MNEPSGVTDIESAIEYIVESCDPASKRDEEALRSSLYDKLDYQVGHFLSLDDSELLQLTNAELGSLTRDVLCAMSDVACEGFTSMEIATLNKMLREFMMYYKGCKEDGRMDMIKGWANQRESS